MEKIWLKQYPQGVPSEINPDQYNSLTELIEQSCEKFASLPAFYNLGVTLTYKQINHYVGMCASYFQNVLKIPKGSRIAIMMPNVLQYPIIIWAALKAGLIVVNTNPLYTVPELIHQINDSGAETLVVLTNFLEVVEKAQSRLNLKHIIVTDIGDLFPVLKAWGIHFYLKYIKKKIPSVKIKKAISFKTVLQEGRKLPFVPVAITNEDIAFLQYTGGTTGVAKGAMLTHRNMIANVLQAEGWFNPLFKNNKEIMITALPLYHIFSLMANCLFMCKLGALNILITNPRDIKSLLADMAKFKFTAITGVNTLFQAILKSEGLHKVNFSRLKVTLGGGMAVQRVVAEKWEAVTGNPMLEGYGLTETSPCVTVSPITLTKYNGTVGLPIISTEIKTIDEKGNECGINQLGELAVKGPQVMKGYWHKPEETQKVLSSDGWLLTGDIATVDEKGFITIVDRKKDMINVSGFNVYPNEVEDTIVHLPGIVEAAIVGVPDEHSGEAVKAFLVKDNSNLTVSDVLEFCRQNLTAYKVPKHIVFCKELPKSNVGKILRRSLRTEKPA